jgi:hypothetical protein
MKNFYRENCNSKTDIGHFKNNILKELSAFKMLEEVKGRSKDIEKKEISVKVSSDQNVLS